MRSADPDVEPVSRPAATDDVVRVENLVKRYPGRPVNAVDGISFGVARGEIFGLLGPNGAGKTTTIGILTTRVRPTSGVAEISGVDVGRHPVEAKRLIAVVPQRNNLDRSLTARQNLTFHAAYFGVPRREREERALRLLDQFGLGDRADEKVDRYSGGMAQRLMIARALMHQPEVLFLDEPTTGLDPQSRLFVWDRVRELNDAGLSVVLTTHAMDEAESMCHRVAIMDHGKLLALDAPQALKRQVPGAGALELTLQFPPERAAAAAADLMRALAALPGVEQVERVGGDGEAPSTAGVGSPSGPWPGAVGWGGTTEASPPGQVVLRLYTGDRAGSLIGTVAHAAAAAGADLKDLKSAAVSLEDVFIHLTGRALR
jgi:ABC-2 type transport system ATP-binding protein